MAQAEMQTGTVAGFFDSEGNAERAISELISAGFTRGQIGVALSSGSGATTGGTGMTSGQTGATSGQTTAGSIATGVAAQGEGVWDKVKSFFGGNEAEPYAGEQTGNGMSTREITSEAGYGNGYDEEGYHSDAVHHSLSGLSVQPERASYFGGRLSQGDQGAVVTVSAAGRASEAEAILQRNGADLGNSPSTQVSQQAGYGAAKGSELTTGTQNIKLYGEVLRVHKDRVSRGDVNIRKEVVTEMQTIEVPVTREELVIERIAGTGEMMPDGEAFGAQTIRVPLTEEVASVDKQAFVREQVNIGKRDVSTTESFDESIRHEELKIDDTTKLSNTKL